jgi:hypothetical protein
VRAGASLKEGSDDLNDECQGELKMAQNVMDLVDQLSEEARRWFLSLRNTSGYDTYARILKQGGPENFEKYWKEHKKEYDDFLEGRFVHISPSTFYAENRKLRILFNGIETDPDTHLLRIGYGHVGGYPVRKDRWNQEGVKGQSVIFRSEDVSHLSDSELENLVRDELQITGQITLGRTKRFTFVNHSFQI